MSKTVPSLNDLEQATQLKSDMSSILGFLVGAGVCVAFSEQFIQQEFIESTRQLAKSVDELHASTEKVKDHDTT